MIYLHSEILPVPIQNKSNPEIVANLTTTLQFFCMMTKQKEFSKISEYEVLRQKGQIMKYGDPIFYSQTPHLFRQAILNILFLASGIQKAEHPNETVYDIVFDKPFLGGMTLNCSRNRGYRCSHLYFINISHGDRLSQVKTPRPTPQPVAQPTGQSVLRGADAERPSSAFVQWYQHQLPPQPFKEDKNDRFREMWSNMQGPKPRDDTNVLKQILKIGEKPKIEEPVRNFFESVGKEPNGEGIGKSYNMMLFAYFQRQNLGQPRFQFIRVGSKIVAQVKLPDGKHYTGLECDDKESACESAALQALAKLGEITSYKPLMETEKDRTLKIMESQNKLEKALLKTKDEEVRTRPTKTTRTTSISIRRQERTKYLSLFQILPRSGSSRSGNVFLPLPFFLSLFSIRIPSSRTRIDSCHLAIP